VPPENYGLAHLELGAKRATFDFSENRAQKYARGGLVIKERSLEAHFVIPDCLDSNKKSFNWGHPIFLGDGMFHCQLKLETRGPGGGSYFRRRAATRDYAGGIDFAAGGDVLLGRVCDSEGPKGRGREERVSAMWAEEGDTSAADFLRAVLDGKFGEFDSYVSSHPSPG
jgi:hypothetical protein